MKSKVFLILIGMMVVFGLSMGPSFSQQSPLATDPMKMEPKAGAMGEKKELSTNHRGSDFMNKSVKNDKGETLGNVKDFVFDRDGELSYIIVSSAAAAEKMIPIPFTSGIVKFQDDSVVVSNLDKMKLDQAPTFSSAEWSKLEDPAFESRIHGYYQEGGAMKGGGSTLDMQKTAPGTGSGAGAAPGEKKY